MRIWQIILLLFTIAYFIAIVTLLFIGFYKKKYVFVYAASALIGLASIVLTIGANVR